MVSLPAGMNLDQIVRIQFYSYRGKDEATKWFSATDCRNLNLSDETSKVEFPDGKRWICPNISEFELLNDPWLFDHGANMIMVVNRCDVAQKKDLIENLKTYVNKDKDICANETDITKYAENIVMYYKMVENTFDPTYYAEH